MNNKLIREYKMEYMEKKLHQWKILVGQEIKMEILAQGNISKLWKENEIK